MDLYRALSLDNWRWNREELLAILFAATGSSTGWKDAHGEGTVTVLRRTLEFTKLGKPLNFIH